MADTARTAARQALGGKPAAAAAAAPHHAETADSVKVPDWVGESQKYDIDDGPQYETPSKSPFPVMVACQPLFVDNKVANNVWIKELKGKDKEIDHEKFMGEWFEFIKILSAGALVYLLPPTKGLQDLVYVNSFVYLPHVKKRDTIILSNFTAPGRAGEEDVARRFLTAMGYLCVKPPFKFEGWPELKWLKDNIYFGGYGFRTDERFHSWVAKKYGCRVIKIKEKDEFCYHLDCNLFVLDTENVIACTQTIDKPTVKEIEKVANIFPVTDDDVYEDACNIVRAGDMLIAASSIQYMKESDPLYKKQKNKNQRLEKICSEMGLELILVSMEELAKSGAATSCLVTPLSTCY